jgi:formylglycine-generating enzyme required for sulfatase activity
MKQSIPLLAALLLALATLPASSQDKADPQQAILKRFFDEFVLLTPGKDKFPASFQMGSADGPDTEKPVHTVTFKYPFHMARYEVTQELWQAMMRSNPSKWKGPRNSVEKITWDEAVEFCKRATEQMQKLKLLGSGDIIRLPSEAEWEYACRAGTTTRYSFGDDVRMLTDFAWYTGNAAGNDPPVGKKKANPWGLYDMHGYIWEWCQDSWHPSYDGAPTDGSARDIKDAKERVARGGAWTEKAEQCRSAARGHWPAATRSDAIGFRCVLKKGE